MKSSVSYCSNYSRQIVGLIPAAGQGKRVSPLPCSKELFPIGFQLSGGKNVLRPKVACHYLLEKMQKAGAKKTFVVLREGKWDIPSYLGDGEMVDMHLAYLMMNKSYGTPFTLNQAYPFLQNDNIVFGFPDIIFKPENAFELLLAHQRTTQAKIVLGLFPADKPHKMDMVKLDEGHKVKDIIIKPKKTKLQLTWIIAVWTPAFSQYMHEYLSQLSDKPERELYVGDVILAAIKEGMQVETVTFSQGKYVDVGTPGDLARAVNGSWM